MRVQWIVLGWLVLLAGPALAVEEPEPERTLCEPELVDSGIEAYGLLATFKPGQLMILPDFRLRVHPETPDSLDFTVWTGQNQDLQRLRWPRRSKPVKPLVFTVEGKSYVLELGRSILQVRPLADNELVIWPREEYRARRQDPGL